jgi:tetratricopeptide (TPR) repeat protein
MRLAVTGQHQLAISIAQRAEAIARSQVAPDVQSYDLAEVIVALAEVGEYEKAESLASSLTDPYWKARAQAAARSGSDMAVEALARVGEYRRAETVADSMIATDLRADAPARDRSEALTRVARALAETGQFQKAEEIARSIDLGYFRGQALAQVAEALAAAGQRAEAEVMARSITEPNWWQSRALARIAREFARADDADGAARVATAACAAGRWTLAVESMLRLIPSAPEKLERLMRDQ